MEEWDRKTEWRQGHLLGDDVIEALGLRDSSIANQVVVVATHDCDLAQAPDNEPCVEVVIGSCIEEVNGTYTHAKTSRRLHIRFGDESGISVEFEAVKKVSNVDKLALNRFEPRTDVVLTPENKNIFQRWLASRYRRSAFPDKFETRLKAVKLDKAIARILKPLNKEITGIFFDVDDGVEVDRVNDDDTYTLNVTLLHSEEPSFVGAENAAKQACKAIAKAFEDKLFAPNKKWKSIELQSCDFYSESVLTYQNFKQLKRWNLDHISMASDPQQEIPD